MPDRALDLSTCPLCSLDPTFAMKTTQGSKLTTQNLLSQGTVRACVAPTSMEVDDGREPALFIIFHKEEDAEFVTAAELQEETTTGEGQEATTESELEEGTADDASDASADPNKDASDASPDLSTLTDFERRIYEHVKRETPALAGIQGKFADTGRSPAEIGAAVNSLVSEGILEGDEDGYEVVG